MYFKGGNCKVKAKNSSNVEKLFKVRDIVYYDFGTSTAFTTCITPLLWFTSAIVTKDLPPEVSVILTFLPFKVSVNGTPATVVTVAFPLAA